MNESQQSSNQVDSEADDNADPEQQSPRNRKAQKRAARQAQREADQENPTANDSDTDTSALAPAEPDAATKDRPRNGNKGGGGNKNRKKNIEVVEIARPAERMQMKRRHAGLLTSFFLAVLAPTLLVGWYLSAAATDQYASRSGFTVRQEESGSATDLLGGLASITGGSTNSDAQILYEYIQSQEIVEKLNAELSLLDRFSRPWPDDPIFAIWPDASIEDLLWYWKRVVSVSYDQGSGLIELEVRTFRPEDATAINAAIIAASQSLINQINAAAREDLMRYTELDLATAVDRLRNARQALTEFRSRNQIVDLEADIQGQMGVVNTLQQQLAEALIELDLLAGRASAGDPRVEQAQRRIEVIRERIDSERGAFADAQINGVGRDYPKLLAEFEGLVVDQEFAEETYRSALAAVDLARDKASRQSRYLATYIAPTHAQTAEYPRRAVLFGLTALFLLLTWGILAMIYYSLRDRR